MEYVVGLGANLGKRVDQLRAAVNAVREFGVVVRASSLYETPALGPPQPDYMNAAILLDAPLAAAALLRCLLEVEQRLGRVRNERWGPRTIDLDILWSPDTVLTTPELSVPHPELKNRAFALVPLLEVAPSATDPLNNREPYGRALERLCDASISPVPGSESGRWLVSPASLARGT